jgi:hypothetical protein
MAEERIRATDRLSAPAALSAFVACFAIVASPSLFASLFLVATETSWPPLPEKGPASARSVQSSESAHESVYLRQGIEPTAVQPVGPSLAVGAPAVQISAPVPRPEALAADRTEPFAIVEVGKVETAEPTEPPGPERDLREPEHVREVQERLVLLGHLSVRPTGFWGRHSQEALRAFRESHQLGTEVVWDAATEKALFSAQVVMPESFAGIWAADPSACSGPTDRKAFLPTVIDDLGAFAGQTSCAFKSRKPVSGAWQIVAECASERARWTAHVRLAVSGNRLTWSSERGSQTYVRCTRRAMLADASR